MALASARYRVRGIDQSVDIVGAEIGNSKLRVGDDVVDHLRLRGR